LWEVPVSSRLRVLVGVESANGMQASTAADSANGKFERATIFTR